MIPTNLLALFLVLQPGGAGGVSPPKSIVLKAARLFDGQSGATVPNGMVIVEGKSIKAVGVNLKVPEGSTEIDLGDATLCPGFIDAHTHLTHERSADYNQGFVQRDAPGGRRAGDPLDGLRPTDGRGRLHDGPRRRLGRLPRRRPAELDRKGGGSRPADADLRPRRSGPPAATPTATGSGTTCSRRSTRPRGSPTARIGSARRSATRSSTAPTRSSSAPRAACCRWPTRSTRPSSPWPR